MTGFAIAIDGPVGVGKSTTARLVAQKLGFSYIDTGAMYRAVALYNIQRGIDLTNAASLENSMKNIEIELRHINDEQCVYLNGDDVTNKIRTQEISESASVVAAQKTVRLKMVEAQQKMAETGQVVMDGRDIGTHVLPWAQLKVYLDADIDIRTKRRMEELISKGQPAQFEKIKKDTEVRDHRDKTRTISPLRKAEDAIVLDTGNITPEEVATKIIKLLYSNNEKFPKCEPPENISFSEYSRGK